MSARARTRSGRVAKNLPPLKTVAELDKAKETQPDVMLDQAAQIMTDVVTGVRPAPAQKTARAGD